MGRGEVRGKDKLKVNVYLYWLHNNNKKYFQIVR